MRAFADHYADRPDVYLLIPRYAQDDLWRTILVRLDEVGVRRAPEARFAKVAKCRWAVIPIGHVHVSRQIDDTIAVYLPWTRVGPFFLLERLEDRSVIQAEEDVSL